MSVLVQVKQGATCNWKMMCKRGSTTIAQIRAAIEASPQSFNCKAGEYGEIDFRLNPDTEVLEESFVITAATLLYAKKKVLKKASSAPKAKAASPTKKKVAKIDEEDLVVDLPKVSGAPETVTQKGSTLLLHFSDIKDCDEFLATMCTEWDVDLGSIKSAKKKEMKEKKLAAAKALVAALENSEPEEEEAGEQLIKKKVVKKASSTVADESKKVVKKRGVKPDSDGSYFYTTKGGKVKHYDPLLDSSAVRSASAASAASEVAAATEEEDDEVNLAMEELRELRKRMDPSASEVAAATEEEEQEEEEEEDEEEEAEVDLAVEEEEVEEVMEDIFKPKPVHKVSKKTMEKLQDMKKKGITVDGDVDYVLQTSDEEDVLSKKVPFKPRGRGSK